MGRGRGCESVRVKRQGRVDPRRSASSPWGLCRTMPKYHEPCSCQVHFHNTVSSGPDPMHTCPPADRLTQLPDSVSEPHSLKVRPRTPAHLCGKRGRSVTLATSSSRRAGGGAGVGSSGPRLCPWTCCPCWCSAPWPRGSWLPVLAPAPSRRGAGAPPATTSCARVSRACSAPTCERGCEEHMAQRGCKGAGCEA